MSCLFEQVCVSDHSPVFSGNTSTHDAVMARCAAHLAYDEQTRCATPARKPERFCPVHREEHRLAYLKLDQVVQAAEESHAKTDATMNDFRSGRARTTDVTANVRSYLAALDEELQVVEVHQQLFQCKRTWDPSSRTLPLACLSRVSSHNMKLTSCRTYGSRCGTRREGGPLEVAAQSGEASSGLCGRRRGEG